MSKSKSGKPAPPAAVAGAETPKEATAPGASTPAGEGNAKARGPVEEVIAKRARQLAKKIQRFKDYSSKPLESLNADQKVAVQSLPALEGAYNELQELIKPGGLVENAELVEAGRYRDLQKDADIQRASAGTSSISDFQNKLTPRLALFIRLHALLHPARPSDHQHLTFGHLDLPSHLQDEVQATDVLRAGRMWDDLTRGGDEAKVVLQGLVDGPKGQDEENDHIHHLLDLLSQPPAETSFPPTHPSSPTREDTIDLQTSADGEYPAEHPTEIIPPASLAASRRESVVETPNGAGGGGFLNFLQEDELHHSPAGQAPALGEDDYEVVPMLEPHQTSGLQPPLEEVVPENQASGNTSFNWADDHDEEHHQVAAPAAAPEAESKAPKAPETPVAPAVPEAEASPAAAVSSTPAPTPAGPSTAGAKPQTSPNRERGQGQGHRGGRGGRAPPPPVKRETKVVDEDGFEMTVRNRPQAPTRGSGRGRGGGGHGGERGAGPGQGRGGAAGGSSGRGRGGQPRGGRTGPQGAGAGAGGANGGHVNGGHANGGHANGDSPRPNGNAAAAGGQTPQRPAHTSQKSHGEKPKAKEAKQAPAAAPPATSA